VSIFAPCARRGTGRCGPRGDPQAWLALRHSEILRDEWLPPAAPKTALPPLHAYAVAWLAQRDLEDRTGEHYAQLLHDHIHPTFGNSPIPNISPADVRTWHAALGMCTGPTARAHAYDVLDSVLKTAVDDELIVANPCRIRGGGQVRRAKKIKPASLAELEAIAKAMPEKYQLMVLFTAWLALRFGELTELRRSDVDTADGVVHVRRGVVRTKIGRKVKGPKSELASEPSQSRRICCHS
jgi:integrase